MLVCLDGSCISSQSVNNSTLQHSDTIGSYCTPRQQLPPTTEPVRYGVAKTKQFTIDQQFL